MPLTGTNPNLPVAQNPSGGLTWGNQQTPSVTGASYTAGKVLGGVMTFSNVLFGQTGIVQTISITDKNNQSGAMNLYIFNEQPIGTYDNGTTFTLNASDATKLIHTVVVAEGTDTTAGGWTSGGGVAQITKGPLGYPIASSSAGDKIWVLAVCNGSYTYTASCLIFTVMSLQQ